MPIQGRAPFPSRQKHQRRRDQRTATSDDILLTKSQPARQPITKEIKEKEERKKERGKEEKAFPFSPLLPNLRNVGTTLPLRTIHNCRRPINLLRARGSKKGPRGAAILAQVEIDIHICNAQSNQISHLTFPTKTPCHNSHENSGQGRITIIIKKEEETHPQAARKADCSRQGTGH